MISGNVVSHVFEHGSNNNTWKKECYVLVSKVVSKPSLHREVAVKPER